MRHAKFTYMKEDKTKSEVKAYEVLVLNETDTNIKGISLGDMSEETKQLILQKNKEFEEFLAPFVKTNFRQFTKGKVVKEVE